MDPRKEPVAETEAGQVPEAVPELQAKQVDEQPEPVVDYQSLYQLRKINWGKLIFKLEKSTEMEILDIVDSTFWDTANEPLLNVLISHEKTDLALKVVNLMEPDQLGEGNFLGDTALHVAVVKENIKAAQALLDTNPDLLSIRNSKHESPLHKAAASGAREMFWELLPRCRMSQIKARRKDGATILHCAVMGNHFELAMEMARAIPDLMNKRDELGLTVLDHIISVPGAFRTGVQLGLLDSIVYNCITLKEDRSIRLNQMGDEEDPDTITSQTVGGNPLMDNSLMNSTDENHNRDAFKIILKKLFNPPASWTRFLVDNAINTILRLIPYNQDVVDLKKMHTSVIMLLTLIAESDEFWSFLSMGSSVSSYHSTPLTLGTKMGLDEMVLTILEFHPGRAIYPGEDGKNVLHVAVENRRERIVNRLAYGPEMDQLLQSLLFSSIDSQRNNILHLAAKAIDQRNSPTQMFEEIKWFERMKKLLPREMWNHRNEKKQTAQQLFTDNHREMVKEGKDRITSLASTCSSLVAAVVFATGFSIPGDRDKKGNPSYFGKTAFSIFSHAYVIGLSCAVMALVMFLILFSSSYREEDFRRSLPIKYFLAITSLILALLSMLVAYACNIYLSIYGAEKTNMKDVTALVCELTIFPALCVAVMAFAGVRFRFVPF